MPPRTDWPDDEIRRLHGEGWGCRRIGRAIGRPEPSVWYHMRRLGLASQRITPEWEPTEEQRQALDGHVLGDGCIDFNYSHPGRNARFTLTSKWLEYAQHVRSLVAPSALQCPIYEKRVEYKNEKRIYHETYTRRHPHLTDQFHRWYRPKSADSPPGHGDNEKIVPADLVMTPLVARQLYMDDGSLQANGATINIATNSFRPEYVEHLAQLLCAEGVAAKMRWSRFSAYRWAERSYPAGKAPILVINGGVGRENTRAFLDYIGPCPVECFAYKWKWQSESIGPRDETAYRHSVTAEQCVELYEQGLTLEEVGARLSCSVYTVWGRLDSVGHSRRPCGSRSE